MINNINPYPEENFKKIFKKTSLYLNIQKDFPFCLFKDLDMNSLRKISTDIINAKKYSLTPRQQITAPIFSLVPFYYINFLLEKRPNKIYDIGCGWNIFKKYIPNIIGVDLEDAVKTDSEYLTTYADVYDDSIEDFLNYSKNHFEEYESVIAINSLHYYPLFYIRQRIIQFSNLIKKGGSGFITLNIQRMIDNDNEENQKYFSQMKYDELENWIREELDNMKLNFKVFELLTLNDLTVDEYLNGNLRIVIEKD